MNGLNIIPGTPEWDAFRATHLNASEASAVLGISPYYPYDMQDLLAIKTGVKVKEITPFQQGLFDMGHANEIKARAIYNKLKGVVMAPCIIENNQWGFPMGCSLDGMTLDGLRTLEVKCVLNDKSSLWKSALVGEIPAHYQAQLEHQLMVVGAESTDFMVFLNDNDHCITTYKSNTELRNKLIGVWGAFYSMWKNKDAKAMTGDVTAMSDGFKAQWLQYAAEYIACKAAQDVLDEQMKLVSSNLHNLRSTANSQYGVNKVYGYGITVQEIERKGAIDTKRIVKDYKVDEEKYRGKAVRYTKITQEKEDEQA